jgi:predicted GNAT superfamily acetyltransferase
MTIRDYQPGDLAGLHRINEDNVPALNSLGERDLADVIAMANWTLVIEQDGRVAGFVVCLVEGAQYASLNYAWVSERYPSFAYIDRVAIDAGCRSRGLGKRLYAELENRIGDQRPMINLEVNERPPNPGSLRFHLSVGFDVIGRREYQTDDGDKIVVFMSKRLI